MRWFFAFLFVLIGLLCAGLALLFGGVAYTILAPSVIDTGRLAGGILWAVFSGAAGLLTLISLVMAGISVLDRPARAGVVF